MVPAAAHRRTRLLLHRSERQSQEEAERRISEQRSERFGRAAAGPSHRRRDGPGLAPGLQRPERLFRHVQHRRSARLVEVHAERLAVGQASRSGAHVRHPQHELPVQVRPQHGSGHEEREALQAGQDQGESQSTTHGVGRQLVGLQEVHAPGRCRGTAFGTFRHQGPVRVRSRHGHGPVAAGHGRAHRRGQSTSPDQGTAGRRNVDRVSLPPDALAQQVCGMGPCEDGEDRSRFPQGRAVAYTPRREAFRRFRRRTRSLLPYRAGHLVPTSAPSAR